MGSLNFNSKNSLSRYDYINKQTQHQFDKVKNNQYATFFENGAPIFATYLKQSKKLSTTDKGLGNVYENIGKSGKKYLRIKHLPIYNIDPSVFDMENDEFGIHGSFKFEGIITMDTIEPIAEDLLMFEFQKEKYLYKIMNVEVDTILSNNYYKVSIKFDKVTPDNLEEQIVDNFTTLYDNIGSEDKSIIQDDDYLLLQKLENLYENVCEAYFDTFYNELGNCFTYKDRIKIKKAGNEILQLKVKYQAQHKVLKDDDPILYTYEYVNFYDPYLMEFIIRNRLFEFDNSLTSFVFQHTIDTPNDFIKKYKQSIFYNIFKKHSFSNSFRQIPIQDKMTYLCRSGKTYYTKILLTDPNIEPKDLYNNRYCNFSYSYNGSNILYKIILKYLDIENDDNNNIKDSLLCSIYLNKKEISFEEYTLSILDNFYCEENIDYFIGVPMVLYLLKQKINNISINNIK